MTLNWLGPTSTCLQEVKWKLKLLGFLEFQLQNRSKIETRFLIEILQYYPLMEVRVFAVQIFGQVSPILSKRGCIYRLCICFLHTSIKIPKITISLAWMHGRVIIPSNDAKWSNILCYPTWNDVTWPCIMEKNFEYKSYQMNPCEEPMRKFFKSCSNEVILDFLESYH